MKTAPALAACLAAASLASAADTPAVVRANHAFAGDIYQQLSASDGAANVFFSPFSITSALAVAWEGARGETAAEMAKVLHLPSDNGNPWPNARTHTAMGALGKSFNKQDKPFQLAVANALWGDQSFPFSNEFLTAIQPHYDVQLEKLDFRNHPEPSRTRINSWVEEKTNDRIKDLLPSGIIMPDTRLVITNAIYFKANWAEQFDLTSNQPFHLANGKEVKVPLMHQPSIRLGLHKANGFQVVQLPYKGNSVAMTILLPDSPDGLPAIEKASTPEAWDDWSAKLDHTMAELYLPKFRLETEYELRDPLKDLGMRLAFSDRADFSGISKSVSVGDLTISAVIHKAFVDVDETGTEAAAATGIVMRATSAPADPPPVIRIDRPFLFAIRDLESGTLLFLGRVTDPR